MNSSVRRARIWAPKQRLPGQLQLAAGVEVVSGDLKSESVSGRFPDLSADSVSMIRAALLANEDVLFGFDSPPLDGSPAYFDKGPYKSKLWRILKLLLDGAFEAKARQAGRTAEESDSSTLR